MKNREARENGADLLAAPGLSAHPGAGLPPTAAVPGVDSSGPAAPVARGRFPSPAPLVPGFPGLLIQTGGQTADVDNAAALVRAEGMGMVLTISSRVRKYHERLRVLARRHVRVVGPVSHVLVDAGRYTGKNRHVGTGLSRSWIDAQRAAGLSILLTDSPFLPSGDRTTLVTILAQARTFGDGVVVVLPLDLDWLTKRAERDFLINAVNEASVPVALVLQHTGDPLGSQKSVDGLIQLLDSARVPVGLLRCDLSVIGSVAFGASFGAVGTTTGLRHLYPYKAGGGGYREPRIAALVANCMAYRTLEKINAAIADAPHDMPRWKCLCDYCYGRTLDCIHDEVHAYQHSLSSISLLGSRILDWASDLDRRHSWVDECEKAQLVNIGIGDDTGITWEPPGFLGAWRNQAAKLPPRTYATT